MLVAGATMNFPEMDSGREFKWLVWVLAAERTTGSD